MEPCDDFAGGSNGNNGGCNNPAGPTRKYTPIEIGQTVFGSSRASNGSRDHDWYVASGMPVNQRFMVDWSMSSQASMRLFPAAANFNYSLCQTITFVAHSTRSCGEQLDVRDFYTTVGQIPLAGGAPGTGDEYLWQIRNNATSDGYPCGVNDAYWFRVNYVMAFADCTPVPMPSGTVGIDFDDERDPSVDTFNGLVGFSGVKNEPCCWLVSCGAAHRGKAGCNVAPATRTDGDFIRLTPGKPMVGVLDAHSGGSSSRDVDWYKFELLERSIVTWKVECGGPVRFTIQENVCSAGSTIAEDYSTVATLGHCGARCLELTDTFVLEEGVYIIVGTHHDAFGGGASCGSGYSTDGFNALCSGYSAISGTGSAVSLCGDNNFAQLAIAPFDFYGKTYTQVNISTNGYISFGIAPASDTPRAIPSNSAPNAVIAPFWNDWKVACQDAVGVGGSPSSDWILQTGDPGSEVTVIEWTNLRKSRAFHQSASFQVVLTHSNGMIEFRYGAFAGLSKKDLDRIAVGIEDDSGLRGVSAALTGAFLTGNSCIRFFDGTLPPSCCPGNANKAVPGAVDFDDITAVLANWGLNCGAATGPGDANCDGLVNFDDITAVLSNWLQACP